MAKTVIEGSITVIQDTEIKSPKFQKRTIVVTEPGKYPNTIPIELKQEKTAWADNLTVGQHVRVECGIDGNEWKGKYFCNITAIRIEPISGAVEQAAASAPEAPMGTPFG